MPARSLRLASPQALASGALSACSPRGPRELGVARPGQWRWLQDGEQDSCPGTRWRVSSPPRKIFDENRPPLPLLFLHSFAVSAIPGLPAAGCVRVSESLLSGALRGVLKARGESTALIQRLGFSGRRTGGFLNTSCLGMEVGGGGGGVSSCCCSSVELIAESFPRFAEVGGSGLT